MSFLNKLTLHNVKKMVAQQTQATPDTASEQSDPAYEHAHTQFLSYHQHLLTIKTACDNYAQHYYGLFSSSHTIIHNITLAVINNDPAILATSNNNNTSNTTTNNNTNNKNTFTILRDNHLVLEGSKEQSIALALNDHVIKPLENALLIHDRILKTITQRNDLAKELDYYAGKVNGLIADQHEAMSKHKEISAKEVEKLARNQKKKDETASMFATINNQLVTEMESIVKEREELLLNIVTEFEKIEQSVLELYATAVGIELANNEQPGGGIARKSRSNSLTGNNSSNLVVPALDGHINPIAAQAASSASTNSLRSSRSPSHPAPPPSNPPPHPRS